jgi:MSHA pilin protein MshD
MHNRYKHSKQKGMTLVEMVISIVLISIAMTAMLTVFSTSMGRSADPLWKNKSLKLAQAYLDEILSKKYDKNTPLGGIPALKAADISCDVPGPAAGVRGNYDNIDDYNGLSEAPKLVTGGGMASYSNYSIDVTVVCDGTGAGLGNNKYAKLITVTVTSPNNTSMPFSVYRGNF